MASNEELLPLTIANPAAGKNITAILAALEPEWII